MNESDVGMIDVDFEFSEDLCFASFRVTSVSKKKPLTPQVILDAVSDVLLHEFGLSDIRAQRLDS